MQIDASVDRLQRLLHGHPQPFGAIVLETAGLADDDRAAIAVPGKFQQLAERFPPRVARAEDVPLLVGVELDLAVMVDVDSDDIEDLG